MNNYLQLFKTSLGLSTNPQPKRAALWQEINGNIIFSSDMVAEAVGCIWVLGSRLYTTWPTLPFQPSIPTEIISTDPVDKPTWYWCSFSAGYFQYWWTDVAGIHHAKGIKWGKLFEKFETIYHVIDPSLSAFYPSGQRSSQLSSGINPFYLVFIPSHPWLNCRVGGRMRTPLMEGFFASGLD